MKFFKKKWRITLIIVAAVAFSGFALEHFISFNPISTAVRMVTSPIKHGFSFIAYSLENARDFIWDMRAYRKENARLSEENLELKRKSRDAAAYIEENERLKELLDLRDSMDRYTTVAARVISHSSKGWYDKLELSRGAIHGVAVGNTVVTPAGVVGRITEVGPGYSVVTTILDKSSAVGIRISRTGGTGLVEGDEELSKNMYCKLSFIDRNTPVITGDVLETSGSGDIYPPGFILGSIVSISADSTGTLRYAAVEPAVDFDTLGEVLIINGVNY